MVKGCVEKTNHLTRTSIEGQAENKGAAAAPGMYKCSHTHTHSYQCIVIKATCV